MLVAGLDVGGSSVKAWVRDLGAGRTWQVQRPLATQRPAPHRAELDPGAWERACRTALGDVVAQAGRPGGDFLGLTVSSLRQGFVLLDGAGEVLGPGVLNSDRRGGPYAGVLTGRHELTGHWPAPELTLPKLLAVAAEEPERWAAVRRVLFVHDWLLWLLSGAQVTEVSYACAGAMADVAARTWAAELVEECGIAPSLLAPLVEAGTVVGELRPGWALPEALPVVAGCGDTQLAAMGVGGLDDGVVVVVAGSSTPVLAATDRPVRDPLGRPWVSTHAAPRLWAAEGNAGYPGTWSGWWDGLTAPERPTAPGRLTAPGTERLADDRPGPGGVVVAVTAAPYWSQETWEHQPPVGLVGLRPDTTAADVRAALIEAHAFGVRGSVEDLERALGRTAAQVVVTGGAAADGRLPALLAQVLGRDVRHAETGGAAEAGAHLVARGLGAHTHRPGLPERVLPAGDAAAWQPAYERWRAAGSALRALGD